MTGSSVAEVRRFVEIVEPIGETLDDVPLQVAGHYYRTYVVPHLGRLPGSRARLPAAQGAAPGRPEPRAFSPGRLPGDVVSRLPGPRPRRARRVRGGRRARPGRPPDRGSRRSPVQRELRVAGPRAPQECQGRPGSGRRPSRARARSQSGAEFHATDARRHGVAGARLRMVGTRRGGRLLAAASCGGLRDRGGWVAPGDERRAAGRCLPGCRAAGRCPGHRRPGHHAGPPVGRARPRGVGPPPPRRDCRRILAVPT